MSDRLGARDIRWSLWFVALVFVAAKPLAIGFYLVDSTPLALVLFALPGIAGAIYFGPSIAVLHDRIPPVLRPLASALFLFLVNFLGLGAGPLLVGVMSERVFAGMGPQSLGYTLVVMQILGLWGGLHYYPRGAMACSPAISMTLFGVTLLGRRCSGGRCSARCRLRDAARNGLTQPSDRDLPCSCDATTCRNAVTRPAHQWAREARRRLEPCVPRRTRRC